MKNNLPYYRHYNNSHLHGKFKMLRAKYGWEGEGKFWALNNMIAQSEQCWLDLNKEYNKGSLCTDLSFTLEDFDKFIEYLSKTCDLIIFDNGKITTEIIQEDYNRVASDRESAKQRKQRNTSKPEITESSGELKKNAKFIKRCESFLKEWNVIAIADKLTVAMKLTNERIERLNNRFKESEFNTEKLIQEIKCSDFLLGKTADKGRQHWFTFDWLISDNTNYIKILEGKFRNNENEQKGNFTGRDSGANKKRTDSGKLTNSVKSALGYAERVANSKERKA